MRAQVRAYVRRVGERVRAVVSRCRRVERPTWRDVRRWLETTSNLLHLTALVAVPLLIGVVTWLSNAVTPVLFLLYPPLASGTFTLFADPEGKYSSPVTFVGGMTLGALAGWAAGDIAATFLTVASTSGPFSVSAPAAALAILSTGVLTWALDLEEPTAFSTALLVLLLEGSRIEYVLGVAVSSTLVAIVFYIWRERFYEHRARYLYRTTGGDDHVLVPMRSEPHRERATAVFAGHIAAAHDAGKVVLLDVVGDDDTGRAERAMLEDREGQLLTDGGDLEHTATGEVDVDPEAVEERAVAESATELERVAADLEAEVGVPCEVVVAVADEGGWSPEVVFDTVEEVGCDLVVTPYEERDGSLSPFVKRLFDGETDVVAFRSVAGGRTWTRAMVAVRDASDVAHAMGDFARRVVGAGHGSVAHCVDRKERRREAETMLADVVDAFGGHFETRVDVAPIEQFLEENAHHYDLLFVGASSRRSAASRFLSPPTFERIDDVDTDVAIVHRGR